MNTLRRIVHVQKIGGLSGSEKHLAYLVQGLIDYGLDARLVLLVDYSEDPSRYFKFLEEKSIKFAVIPTKGNFNFKTLFALSRLFREIKPDLVHSHLIHADVYSALTVPYRTPLISTRHNDDPFWRNAFVKLFLIPVRYREAGAIYISRYLSDFFSQVGDAYLRHREIIHYGAPSPLFVSREQARKILNITPSSFCFGIVARLVEQKGHLVLIEAFHKVIKHKPDAELWIIGDGPSRNLLVKASRELGIENKVNFVGFRQDAVSLLKAFDVFVHPSLWEGFGLSVLEAMFAAVPIVSTQTSAIPELINDSCGLLVPVNNAELLAHAMSSLTQSKELRIKLGKNACEKANRDFSITAMIHKTLGFYDTVCY